MARRTIFDDVFRTICQKMPHLLIPLINEVFGTDYPADEEIKQLRNEHFTVNGEIITDAIVSIRGFSYHVECQSSDDTQMIIRMAEYDFAIAFDSYYQESPGVFRMEFPESCVVYLRKTDSVSRSSKLNIHFKNGSVVEYSMNVICVQDYSLEEIFNKKLFMFLPYYILRYEKNMPTAKSCDREKLNKLLEDYNVLVNRLETECKDNNTGDFNDIYNMIIRIINQVVKSKTIKGRLKTMNGRLLELPSEKLRREGMEIGIKQGIEWMLKAGRTPEQIADFCGYDLDKIQKVKDGIL